MDHATTACYLVSRRLSEAAIKKLIAIRRLRRISPVPQAVQRERTIGSGAYCRTLYRWM